MDLRLVQLNQLRVHMQPRHNVMGGESLNHSQHLQHFTTTGNASFQEVPLLSTFLSPAVQAQIPKSPLSPYFQFPVSGPVCHRPCSVTHTGLGNVPSNRVRASGTF